VGGKEKRDGRKKNGHERKVLAAKKGGVSTSIKGSLMLFSRSGKSECRDGEAGERSLSEEVLEPFTERSNFQEKGGG